MYSFWRDICETYTVIKMVTLSITPESFLMWLCNLLHPPYSVLSITAMQKRQFVFCHCMLVWRFYSFTNMEPYNIQSSSVFFILHTHFEIHPCCWVYQQRIPCYFLSVLCCVDFPQFIYPTACWWALGLFPVWGCYR